MSLFRKFNVCVMSLLLAMAMVSVTSCNDDDDDEVIIYHKNFIQGKINDYVIDTKEINANIQEDKSIYDVFNNEQTDWPEKLDWKVVLVETNEIVITMNLHIDYLLSSSTIIYSPNEADPCPSKSSCYVTVIDLKNNTKTIYHPTHPSPINARWTTFVVTADSDWPNKVTVPGCVVEYKKYKWPGIDGHLQGTLTSDDESKDPLNIDIDFLLY